METNSVGFIGGGRITRIFLRGFANKKVLPGDVKVYEPDAGILAKLQADFKIVSATDSALGAAKQDLVILAVHPPVMMETLQSIKNTVTENTIVISLAPKISIEKIASVLTTKKLVRMIPNATSFINKGYNPVSFSDGFDKKEKKQVLKFLGKLGNTFETEEAKLESYAIVSAMLPTCFWFQWEEIENIALEAGLSAKEAKKTVYSTMKKALKIYYKSGLTPEQVMDLIPVKPIGENEPEIKNILNSKLLGLYSKIKP